MEETLEWAGRIILAVWVIGAILVGVVVSVWARFVTGKWIAPKGGKRWYQVVLTVFWFVVGPAFLWWWCQRRRRERNGEAS